MRAVTGAQDDLVRQPKAGPSFKSATLDWLALRRAAGAHVRLVKADVLT